MWEAARREQHSPDKPGWMWFVGESWEGQDRHSRDAYFLQVTLCEGQEDPEIHVLLLKHLQVLQAPNLIKECCQVLQHRQNKLTYTLTTKASHSS